MKVTIVGAGPGDPDLITVKGLKAMQEADVVMYADSLVSEELIERAGDHAEIIKTAGMHLEEMVEAMASFLKKGKRSRACIPETLPFMARSLSRSRS